MYIRKVNISNKNCVSKKDKRNPFLRLISCQNLFYVNVIKVIYLRSATTNPTGKNKLEAGKKGTKDIANEMMTRDECFLNLHSDAQAE